MLNVVNDILFGFFMVGVTGIYIPQFYLFWKQKNSFGFNYWFLFLGHSASLISWMNASIHYLDNWRHCQGAGPCAESIFGFILIFYQWILFWLFYVLFIYYYPFETLPKDPSPISQEYPPAVGLPSTNSTENEPLLMTDLDFNRTYRKNYQEKQVTWYQRSYRYLKKVGTKKQWTWGTFILSHFIGLTVFSVTIALIGLNHWHGSGHGFSPLEGWSDLLGGLASFLIILHYLPQIWEIWKIKQAGSMSLITLACMIIGTFLWCYFLATQPNVDPNSEVGDPAIWVPYLLVGLMQLVLFCLAFYYEYWRKIDERVTAWYIRWSSD